MAFPDFYAHRIIKNKQVVQSYFGNVVFIML